MAPEVKFLGDGSAVLVVGEGDPRATSLDGGRTTTEVPQLLVARLELEEIEQDAVLDERPVFDAETATWIQKGQEPVAAPAVAPSGVTDAPVVPARGEAQTADQLQAEIDALQARKAALGTDAPTGSNEGGTPEQGRAVSPSPVDIGVGGTVTPDQPGTAPAVETGSGIPASPADEPPATS